MRRRDWLLTLASGLSLSLVCGCSQFGTALPVVANPPAQKATAPAAAPLPAPTGALQPGSPYGTLPPVAPREGPALPPARETRPAAAAGPADRSATPADTHVTQVKSAAEPAKENGVQPSAAATAAKLPGDQSLAAHPNLEPNIGDPAVVHALRYLLVNRPADAVHVLEGYDQPTQNILLCLLPLLAHLSDKGIQQADPDKMAVWVDELERVLDPLRHQAALVLDKMCFCSSVKRIGVFVPLPPDHPFRPGDPVQIYVEIRNFVCALHDSAYEIHLSSMVRMTRLVNGKEQVEWEQGFPDRYQPDRSQSPRHDYFSNYCFSIPPNLPLGDYTLTLYVTDLASTPPRVAKRSLPLRLTTRPGM